MKPGTAGILSGCVVWLIAFSLLMFGIFPLTMAVGLFSAFHDRSVRLLEPLICPEGSTARLHSYPSMTTDQDGNPEPTTAYELYCVDANGVAKKINPLPYISIWTGSFIVIGLVIAALLAFVPARLAAVWTRRYVESKQKQDISFNIEPQ